MYKCQSDNSSIIFCVYLATRHLHWSHSVAVKFHANQTA